MFITIKLPGITPRRISKKILKKKGGGGNSPVTHFQQNCTQNNDYLFVCLFVLSFNQMFYSNSVFHESVRYWTLNWWYQCTIIAYGNTQLKIEWLEVSKVFSQNSFRQFDWYFVPYYLYFVLIDTNLEEQDLRHLAKQIGQEWETLATYLGFNKSQIEHFRINGTNRGIENVIFDMLVEWKQNQPKGNNLRKVLGDALIKTGRHNLAKSVSLSENATGMASLEVQFSLVVNRSTVRGLVIFMIWKIQGWKLLEPRLYHKRDWFCKFFGKCRGRGGPEIRAPACGPWDWGFKPNLHQVFLLFFFLGSV